MTFSTRRNALVLLSIIAAASLAASVAWAHPTPQIRAQQAREKQVIAEVDQIGRNLQVAQDAAWSAQQRLNLVKQSLRQNEYRLHVAKANLHAAQKRVMGRLYSLYVNGSPSTIDVIAGANSVSEMISRAESAKVLSDQDASLGRQALSFEHSVQQRERQLKRLEGERTSALAEKKAKLQQVQSELAQQKHLLASIHTTIQRLQQQEAERERAATAAAAAKLKAQLAAAAAARAAAAQQAAQSPPSSSSGGVVAPPVSIPVGNPGVGHPQAASIALHYLGVPYVWGGSTPSGFDCSGLVMYVYAQLGISLPHYTVAQWNATQPISSSQMQPGDLVFFYGLDHVGIYIGNNQFVDAPHTGAVVRINSLSSYGGNFDGARRVP